MVFRCLVSLSLIALLGACGSPASDRTKQTLRLNIHSEPPSLDPRKATDTTSISVINMCFEGLTKPGQYGEPVLAIAERVEISPDMKTYTFFLREAKWSDGKLVTAYDFEETWKTILDPAFPSQIAGDLYILKNGQAAKEKRASIDEVGVRALDEQTLVVELAHSTPYFLELAASHSFLAVPSHIVEERPDWADRASESFIGNGPFSLKEWRHYNEIVVEKNEHYWDKKQVKLDRIHVAIIEDENTELSMFENNELDWAGHPLSALPTDAIPALAKKYPLNTHPIAATYYYVFNTKVAPFNNVNIRRAFALAINRKEIVQNITQGDQIPATGIVPPIMWKIESPYFHDADMDEARSLFQLGLRELGITAQELPPITLSYNTTEAHHKIAQAIQGQWLKAFGIQVRLENKEWKVFLSELHKHQFQVARLGGVASFNDPSTFLDTYKNSLAAGNHSQWSDPAFTQLLEQAEQSIDQEERFKLLKKAEGILIDQMPIAPIYFYTNSYLKKPYVKGVTLSDLGDMDLKEAYLDKE
jgi:oligopeptide transport system substrate-binding protein